MPAAVRRYWRNGTRWCALFYVEDMFEIRIYDGTALIALWPCESSQRAVNWRWRGTTTRQHGGRRSRLIDEQAPGIGAVGIVLFDFLPEPQHGQGKVISDYHCQGLAMLGRVLIVGDDADAREMYTLALAVRGFQSGSVANAEECFCQRNLAPL
jgi:hypothetical protein